MMPLKTPPPGSRLHGLSPTAIASAIAAAQALELGRADDAERALGGALTQHSEHPEVLRLVAGMHTLRGEHAQAVSSLRRALEKRPQDALYWNTLGSALIPLGDYDAAIAALGHAVALDAQLGVAWYNLGLALTHSVRPDEAASALQHAIAIVPTHISARVLLADQLRGSGRVDEAAAEYRRVIAQQPAAGMAWIGLANLKSAKLDSADIAAMQRTLTRTDVGDDDRIALGFALASALEDGGRYVDASGALAQAHACARRRGAWNAAAFSAHVDSVLAAFPTASSGTASTLGDEAIFIVSLPRSGSTLIEQILATHSQVEGASELPDLPQVLTEESQRRGQPFPQWVAAMRPADWERLGRRYLERTARWRQRHPRFTDKLLTNWLHVGAIRAMLPGARIVAVRRDPLETCLACYRQHLAGNAYTHDFVDLAAYWRDFDRAMNHWRTLHPQHVHENVYEDLTTDPEAQIPALLAFCGLDFEPACLAFHTNPRAVVTLSAAQVRQPLRRDTARAARYGALIDPLRAALRLPAFGGESS
jgi:tetratricopeptide (TPR) repeat protein